MEAVTIYTTNQVIVGLFRGFVDNIEFLQPFYVMEKRRVVLLKMTEAKSHLWMQQSCSWSHSRCTLSLIHTAQPI